MSEPSRRVRRPGGVKKTLIAAVAAIAAVLPLAGCGGDSKPVATSAPSTPCDVATPECLAKTKTTSYIPVPTAKIGQPIRYQAGGDQGAITQEITVLKFKTAKVIADPDTDYTSKPDPGHMYLCVEVRLRNVGTTPGDSYLGSQWFGIDGRTEEPSLVAGSDCDVFGMSSDLSGRPDPQPGKYVTGSTLYELPAAVGALEVTDRDGTPLFRLDYGPQSAQVKINAVGQ